jgi:hypothetical protein
MRPVLPDEPANRHGIGKIDEEGGDERQDDERRRRSASTFVIAVILAIAVGVAPRLIPPNPAVMTASSYVAPIAGKTTNTM